MRPLLRSLLASCLFLPGAASAQTVRVAVQVTENTGGLFASTFASALRGLGDVQPVSASEEADFRLRVAVLCLPRDDCRDPTNYALSISFTQSIEASDVTRAYYLAKQAASDTTYPDANLMTAVGQALRKEGYEKLVIAWAASLGRQRYEQGVKEVVAELDAQCFEKHRVIARAAQYNFASVEWRDAWKAIAAREWLC